ncbi:MAG: leucine-rich repeat protein [Lachnospiraceae bacterium]|nr:leucine-rich repeat protein [Lachnospiraceae bacterium]
MCGRKKGKKNNILYRWIALAMSVTLLIGQNGFQVLAEEKEGMSVPDQLVQETGSDDTSADHENADGSESDAESSTDNSVVDSCICEVMCYADSIDMDCPVCADDYSKCKCIGSDTGEGVESEVSGDEELADEATDGNDGNSLEDEAAADGMTDRIAASDRMKLSDDGVMVTAVGSSFLAYDNKLRCIVTKEGSDGNEVKLTGAYNQQETSGTLDILPTIEKGEITYTVTEIADECFSGWSKLEGVTLPDTVTNIGEKAFNGCSSLTNINIPDGVESIGKSTFSGCSNLQSIGIPSNITSIGMEAFNGCGSLTAITIPEGVMSIGSSAFQNCSSLSSVMIPDTVTSIGSSAFQGCSGLESVTISNGITIIQSNTFQGCSSLKKVEIPEGVSTIADAAFSNCTSLESVSIPSSVKAFGDSSSQGGWHFTGCGKLAIMYITVTQSVTPIVVYGSQYFYILSNNNHIVFQTKDGALLSETTMPTLAEAVEAYDMADGKPDNKWYSWNLTTTSASSGKVTINVKKDDTPWINHNRTLELSADNGATFIQDLTAVSNGTYRIYDRTGVTDGSAGTDTGITVTVDGSDTEVTVNYYTVTFWDGDTAYGEDTLQKPQIVPGGKNVFKPDDPEKTGYVFSRWMTTRDGNQEFDFTNTIINSKTDLYASWGLGATEFLISYYVDGQTISIDGYEKYSAGTEFTLPVLSRQGYTFDGWYTDAGYTSSKVTVINSKETGDKIYYGRWVVNSKPTYPVTIQVQKDDEVWENNGRVYRLKDENGNATCTFDAVEEGTYTVYDVTGLATGELEEKGIDTGVTLVVGAVDSGNADTVNTATVKYYTAAFYDGSTVYGDDTPQKPQIILSGKKVTVPSDNPNKTGYQFAGWMAADGGSTPYNFDAPVTRKTYIFASWTAETAVMYTITASAGEGGSISPNGSVRVNKGADQTFTITPGSGCHVKAIMVDGQEAAADTSRAGGDRQEDAVRYYTFSDVQADHTISVTFEVTGGGGNGGGTGSGSGESNGGGIRDGSSGDNGGNGYTDSQAMGTDHNLWPVSDNGVSGITSLADSASAVPVSASATDEEPKTGDDLAIEIYATVAMIAGLFYLMLYFTDQERGMTEEEKKEKVAALIRWAKTGRSYRRYAALAVIFCLLLYYHSIGKCVSVEWKEVYDD